MTTLRQPTMKLYKRCKSGRHVDCDGKFLNRDGSPWSVCTCDCHSPAVESEVSSYIESFEPVPPAEAAIIEAETIIEAARVEAPAPIAKKPRAPKVMAGVKAQERATKFRLRNAGMAWGKYLPHIYPMRLGHGPECAENPLCHCRFTRSTQSEA